MKSARHAALIGALLVAALAAAASASGDADSWGGGDPPPGVPAWGLADGGPSLLDALMFGGGGAHGFTPAAGGPGRRLAGSSAASAALARCTCGRRTFYGGGYCFCSCNSNGRKLAAADGAASADGASAASSAAAADAADRRIVSGCHCNGRSFDGSNCWCSDPCRG